MSDNDLIRRGDAKQCCTDELRNTMQLLSNPPQSSAAWDARNAINAIPAAQPTVRPGEIERAVWGAMGWALRHAKQMPGDIIPAYTDTGNSDAEVECRRSAAHILSALDMQPTVKPLVWENFDAWTYWARSIVGTYHVKERNGVWRATLETRAGDEFVYEYHTDGLTPGDFEAALLAAQTDYEARILSALDMQPTVSPDVEALVEALEFYAAWDNWMQDERGVSLVDQDEGKTARTILALIEKPNAY